jgi:hypothetical protein
MDDETLMNAGLSTTGVAILLIVVRVLKSLQGKKLVSTCCGRKGEMGVDVVAMTPPPRAVVVHQENPAGSLRLKRLETVGLPEHKTEVPS